MSDDRSPMPVLLDGVRYEAAKHAFKAIGLTRWKYKTLRKELRKWGAVHVREHTIERIAA